MYGKKMVVSEYNLTFGQRERVLNVFGCLKSKITGNQYVIYANRDILDNKIYYGSVHLDASKLVVMASKKDEELIHGIVDDLVKTGEVSNFTFLEIKDRTKVEIISEESFDIPSSSLLKLEEISIPKEKKIEEVVVPKKKSWKARVIFFVLLLIAFFGYYVYTNQGKFFGYGSEIVCMRTYPHEKLKASVTEKITLHYDRHLEYEGVTINTAYAFYEYDFYFEFKNHGEYFEYIPDSFDEDDGYRLEDDTNTYYTIVHIGRNEDFFLEKDFDKAIDSYSSSGYGCQVQEKIE